MATLILLRHARSEANSSGVLAGRTDGVGLDDIGRAQAAKLRERLSDVPLHDVVSSPLQRCRDTLAHWDASREATVEPRFAEVDYGQWTGRRVDELSEESLWKVVQQHPSAAVFPDGEGLAQVQARAVAAVRAHDARINTEHGADAIWMACTHGDVIKAVLADALAMHLDVFQRIVVEPCSVSVVRYTETRPFVLKINDTGPDIAGLLPPKGHKAESPDAVIGGAAGTETTETNPRTAT